MRAGNGTRTRDPNLGKVVLYQLSYSRDLKTCSFRGANHGSAVAPDSPGDGGEGNRTPDLLNAIQALSQLRYAPRILARQKARIRNRELYSGVPSKSRK